LIPDKGYLAGVKELCKEFNVLFICDEIQAGLGRAGKMVASEWVNNKKLLYRIMSDPISSP
jgi:ornithine--oxo-acid transaminase